MPMYGGGYVTGLIPHPEEVDTLYARIDVGGIYTTTNAGDTWEPLTQNIIKDNKRNFQVRSFTIDETNTDKMYFISGNSPYSEDAALWLSNDAGENWTRKKSPLTIGGIGLYPLVELVHIHWWNWSISVVELVHIHWWN